MIFRNVRIHATDVDESSQFGNIIREGVYPDKQVKRIPRDIFDKYFKKDARPAHFRINEDIRKSVFFTRHDLLSLQPIRRDLGLIVCKNVLLHFKERERVDVIKMYHDALQNDGFFVMEQTQKMPRQVADLFEPLVSNAQLFRKVNSPAK